jgi:hypothetical protein
VKIRKTIKQLRRRQKGMKRVLVQLAPTYYNTRKDRSLAIADAAMVYKIFISCERKRLRKPPIPKCSHRFVTKEYLKERIKAEKRVARLLAFTAMSDLTNPRK